MAEQDQVKKVEVENLEDFPTTEIPQPLECEVCLCYEDKLYLGSAIALNAIIKNKANFNRADADSSTYPYLQDCQIAKNWAETLLSVCGIGGSVSGGSGSNNNNSGSGGSSGGSLSCGASASGSGSNCSGSCTANPNGGTPPYTYQWSSGENTKTINNKCSGTYTVTCSDSQGAVAIASVTLT